MKPGQSSDEMAILSVRSIFRPRSYLLHLALADRLRDALGVLIWLLFPGPRWLAQRYMLQGRLAPFLYTLIHPLFVTWQGLLGIRDLVMEREN